MRHVGPAVLLWSSLLAPSVSALTEGPVKWVWSGALTARTATVKARVAPGADEIRLRLSTATKGSRSVPSDGYAEPDANGVVVFDLEGLEPSTEYHYAVEVRGVSSIAGRFTTFAEGPMSFRVVFGSCASTGSNHSVFAAMEALDPSFLIHMGDFHYENIDENDPARFRAAYDRVLRSERQSSLYRKTPIVYVWDDHDFGPNDSDRTNPAKPAALATYDGLVPHYPLTRPNGELDTIQQAFTAGRIRFLVTDARAERTPDDQPDGPEKSLLGVAQREWFFRELHAARDRYPLVVWVNTVPWITEPGSGHGWGRYEWERRLIADRIEALGLTDHILMLSGDGHMVAIDDGSHSNFAESASSHERGFPVVHAAPFDRFARPKGGPYSHGIAARRILFGLIPIQQFGLMEVRDDGERVEVTLTGRNERGELLPGMKLDLLCASACRPVTN